MLDALSLAGADALVKVQAQPDCRKLVLGELPALFYAAGGLGCGAECGEGSEDAVFPTGIIRARVLQLSVTLFLGD